MSNPAPGTAGQDDTVALYEVRKKIYPRAVTGLFANWRIALVWFTQLLFYGLPWFAWADRQAVLFDLGARKFYIFGLVFWPQDFIFLTTLLVLAALSLFLFTAMAGRLFCGYACPQTVYTEIFLWVERAIEGDRAEQMLLDQAPLSAKKFGLKAGKHFVWMAIGLWTGITFVGYFTPIRELLGHFAAWTLGPWETFWIFFYGFATYGNAGWMREQVCKYMCPYARFQSVMFDPDTLVVTYDPQRGEPRGPRRRSVERAKTGLGDCTDCNVCVQVCPTGIDIRRGLQYECIGCGACIDACNQVMDRMKYPRGLIRYSTENVMHGKVAADKLMSRVFRPRTLLYLTLLTAIFAAFCAGLFMRAPLKVDVIRDRGTLVRETAEGLIENVYRLQIMNTDEQARSFKISASGMPNLVLAVQQPVTIPGATTQAIPVVLRVDPAGLGAGTKTVMFHVEDTTDPGIRADEKSSFLVR